MGLITTTRLTQQHGELCYRYTTLRSDYLLTTTRLKLIHAEDKADSYYMEYCSLWNLWKWSFLVIQNPVYWPRCVDDLSNMKNTHFIRQNWNIIKSSILCSNEFNSTSFFHAALVPFPCTCSYVVKIYASIIFI